MTVSWSLTARWIFPVAGPPLPHGVVRIASDRLVAVEPAFTRAVDLDLGNVAVLPGLVNAHTHLDLSGMRGLAPPQRDFPAWLRQVVAHRLARSAEQVLADIQAGLVECIRTGTTLLGDISSDGSSWQPIASSGIRGVVFRELLGLPSERAAQAWDSFQHWHQALPASDSCRAGVSPHAPYSVRTSLYRSAAAAGVPLATHLAETPEELELLERRAGPFTSFLQQLNVWAPEGLATSPEEVVRLCQDAPRLLLAHGNYLDPGMTLPGHATIVYCPRTHAAFGHSPHPYRQFLERGVRVALGTDGLASNPDLDVLAEARFLRRLDPVLPGSTLLHLATLAGAESLGFGEETGSLEAGKSADLIAVEIADRPGVDPHELLLQGNGQVKGVLRQGRWSVPP